MESRTIAIFGSCSNLVLALLFAVNGNVMFSLGSIFLAVIWAIAARD
jgi:hypothetical protein